MKMTRSGRNSAIVVSRSIGLAFLVLYTLQLIAIVWLIWIYYDQKVLIGKQNERIEELERKIQILDIIEDNQIGFLDDEIYQMTNVIYDQSTKLSLDPFLLLAVIMTESSFKRNQVSEMGAVGLMQVKPSIGLDVALRWGIDWPSEDALRNPVTNIEIGSDYLFELILKFGDIRHALIAYNLGETVTREYQLYGVAPPPGYYLSVRDNYLRLRSRFDAKR